MKSVTLAALVLLVAATPTRAQDDDDGNAIADTPHITLVGEASADVAPDLAIITLGVRSHKLQARAAADAVAAAARAVIDAAKATGVASADIATQSINLSQSFDDVHDPQGRTTDRRPSGFDAANTISVRMRDLGKAGALTQTLIDKGANSFDGIDFTLEHPQPVRDKLVAEATADARRQAELVARAAGSKLGRVLLIERPREGQVQAFRKLGAARATVAAAPAAMPIEAGTTSLHEQIKVTWALEPST